MAHGRIRRDSGLNYWPGFVDALSTLILGIIFLLTVFVVVQFFLSQEVAGKDTALSRLNALIATLNDQLAMEKSGKVSLEDEVTRMRATLTDTESERDRLKSAAAPPSDGASEAQNRFYTDLEDWLATTVHDLGVDTGPGKVPAMSGELRIAIERLRETLAEGGSGKQATTAIVNLAESLQGLIHHMRTEQQMIRDWVDAQSEQHRDIRKLLEILVHETQKI